MTKFVEVPGGRLAYTDVGIGPLVVGVPGMGDLRSAYRFLAPLLVEAGYRFVSVDVRGHGESSVAWDDYSVGAIAGDILAVIRSVHAGPACVIGNSMAAAAGVIAAAREPKLVRGLVLIGPFVRDVIPARLAAAIFGPMLGGPWRGALWRMLFKRSFPTRLPDDYAAEESRRDANLAQPGRFTAFRRMAIASKIESERRIAEVTAQTLVLMGTRDGDFPDPAKEARKVGELLNGRVVMIEGAGHYPHVEMPQAVAAEIVPFLQSVDGAPDTLRHAS
ncbi:MAG TPA: alpha/beta hydrolase [Candidatus Elarobacter sp.]|nr:alpha/beta hydrolase [Candidatus Elarobacter sp.]